MLDPLQAALVKKFVAVYGEQPDETIVARALLTNRCDFIELLTDEEFALVRGDGGSSRLRDELSSARERVRKAKIGDVDQAVRVFADCFDEAVAGIGELAMSKFDESSRLRKKAFVSGTTSLTLSIASVVFPIVGMPEVGILSTGMALLSGKSLVSTWKEVRESVNWEAKFKQNPLYYLNRAQQRTTEQ